MEHNILQVVLLADTVLIVKQEKHLISKVKENFSTDR